MFGFRKRKVEVLNHWIAFADGFQTSPLEFYSNLEAELSARKVPKMELTRIEFAEGGLLSEKRTYLRMLRERIVFDVCAAPFGEGFFFSCRTAEIPCVLKLWQILGALGVLLFLCGAFVKVFGILLGLTVLLFTVVTAIYLMRNLVALGLQDLDKTLMQSPLIGSIYEIFFRSESYHRIDSRLCYIHLIPTIVKSLAEDATAEKGVKLVDQYELSPILGDLYKRSSPGSGDAPRSRMAGPEPKVSI